MSTLFMRHQALMEELKPLGEDPHLMLDYLIELGCGLPAYPKERKEKKYQVAGCLARVWLYPTYQQGRLFLLGDSDAAITKGVVAVLVSLFSGLSAEEVLYEDTSFLAQLSFIKLLGAQRKNGFLHMLATIQRYAEEKLEEEKGR